MFLTNIYIMGFTYNVNIFLKKFNILLISKKTIILLYFFILPLDYNFFICSYLNDELNVFENHLNFYFYFILIFTIFRNFNKSNKSKNFINLFIIVKQFKINIFLNKIKLFLISIIFYFNITNIMNFFKYVYISFKNNNQLWYPIYKSYSIFGFYKSTRIKFIDLKNENLKKFKY